MACDQKDVDELDAGEGGSGGLADGGDAPLREPKKHRAEASACAADRDPTNLVFDPDTGDGTVSCMSDADCVNGENGRCYRFRYYGGTDYFCTYDECFADADCDEGACNCGENTSEGQNACIPGNCRVDADCGKGGYCSPSAHPGRADGYDQAVGYFCRTEDDTCVDDADCESESVYPVPLCVYDPAVGHWLCDTPDYVIG